MTLRQCCSRHVNGSAVSILPTTRMYSSKDVLGSSEESKCMLMSKDGKGGRTVGTQRETVVETVVTVWHGPTVHALIHSANCGWKDSGENEPIMNTHTLKIFISF